MGNLSTSSKIIKNALANYAGLIFQLVIAFFLSPFLVHTLGDTKYGIWSIVAALSGYMCLFDLGISSALTRYVSKYDKTGEDDKAKMVVSSGLFLYTLLGLLIILVSPITANLFIRFITFDPSITKTVYFLVIIASFDVALFLVAGTFRGVFQGLQKYDTINFILIIMGAIKAALFFWFLSRGYGLLAMGIITFLEKAIKIIIFYFILKRNKFLKFSRHSIKSEGIACIFRYSFFTFINMAAGQLIYYSDAFVIGYFTNVAFVTYYSIAWTLSEYLNKFCLSFSRVFIPAISEYESVGNFKKIQELLLNGSKYTLIITCLLGIGLLVFGESFINLWMGEKYGAISAPIMMVLIASQFIELPLLISRAVLLGISKHKYMAYVSSLTAILNLLLSIFLIKKYGLIGVALGTVLPQILVYGLFMIFYTCHVVKISVWKYLYKVYVPLIVPALVLCFSALACLQFTTADSYFILLLEASISGSLYLISVFYLSLETHEKENAIGYFVSFKSKFKFAT